MQLPAPIKIGHYKVTFKELGEDYVHDEDDDTKDAWGFYDPKTKDIMIDPGLDSQPVLLAEVLIHETQHAINDVYGIDEDFLHTEEKIVTQSSRGWTQVLIDNPHLMEYIKNKLH
jgi:hypothetical protein